jgi:hypothetical protein
MPAAEPDAPIGRESLQVECLLLHNECETFGSDLFRSNITNIRNGRIMAGLGFLLLATVAPLSFWQLSSVHRVWRIRNPKKVKQHQAIIVFNVVVGLGSILYLAGPFGYVEQGTKTIERMKAFDSVAWSAALLEHKLRSGVPVEAEAWQQLSVKRRQLEDQ